MTRARTIAAVGCLALGVADVLYLNLAALPPLVGGEEGALAVEDEQPVRASRAGEAPPRDPRAEVDSALARPSAVTVATAAIPPVESAPAAAPAAKPETALEAAPDQDERDQAEQDDRGPAEQDEHADKADRPVMIHFSRDQASVGGAARARIERVARRMIIAPDLRAAIDGHTDSRGDTEHNDELSHRRADRVAEILVAAGIASERIEVNAYGETRPLVVDPDGELERKNRRVEIRLTPADATRGTP